MWSLSDSTAVDAIVSVPNCDGIVDVCLSEDSVVHSGVFSIDDVPKFTEKGVSDVVRGDEEFFCKLMGTVVDWLLCTTTREIVGNKGLAFSGFNKVLFGVTLGGVVNEKDEALTIVEEEEEDVLTNSSCKKEKVFPEVSVIGALGRDAV